MVYISLGVSLAQSEQVEEAHILCLVSLIYLAQEGLKNIVGLGGDGPEIDQEFELLRVLFVHCLLNLLHVLCNVYLLEVL